MGAVKREKLEKYLEYKDSGVDMIGQIPEKWKVIRLKSNIRMITGYPFKSDKYSKNGIKLARGINVKEGYFDWKEVQYWPEVTKDLEKYLLQEGDVLIAMDGSKVGKNFCQVKELDLPILLLQRVARLRPVKDLLSDYMYWNIVNNSFLTWVNMSKTDPMIPHIAPKDIHDFVIALPSPKEQIAIANFLDDKTAKIDQAITQKEKLIALLKERKQTLIQQAVTKGLPPQERKKAGLDPIIKLKDSGIDWIGQIPEHWEVTQIRRLSQTTSGATPSSGRIRDYYNGQIPWVRTTDLNNDELFDVKEKITDKAIRETACKVVPKNTVCIAMYGGPGTIGKHAILRFSGTLNQALCGILPSEKLNQDYLYYYSKYYRPHWMFVAKGSRVDPNINQDEVRRMEIPVVPLEEQNLIVDFINSETKKMGSSIALQETQIEKLKEYKSVLIDSAVTGKIKVSGL